MLPVTGKDANSHSHHFEQTLQNQLPSGSYAGIKLVKLNEWCNLLPNNNLLQKPATLVPMSIFKQGMD